MTVTLYTNNSSPDTAQKSLTHIIARAGVMRGPMDILNPVIEISTKDDSAPQYDITQANYLYIAEFNRYYYITGMVCIVDGLWEVSCHVDTLMSWYDMVMSQDEIIIARNETQYNINLMDDKLLVEAGRAYTVKRFPNSLQSGQTSGALAFVLTVAG